MIVGIGVDIVHIPRVEHLWYRYGERFAKRILANSELAIFHQQINRPRYLASRFAAKEACAKALGTGFRGGLRHIDIVVSNDQLGKPMILLENRAKTRAVKLQINSSHLSLSDEVEYAAAFVVLEHSQ